MEAEHTTNLDALDYYLTGRRKPVRSMPLVAKLGLAVFVLWVIARVPFVVLETREFFETAPAALFLLLPLGILHSLLDIVLVVSLCYYSKRAFYILAALAVFSMVMLFSVGGFWLAVFMPVPVLLLYGILQIGNPSTWAQLE
jgi:hypothetical protein